MKKFILGLSLVTLFGFLFWPETAEASISNIKDTISTSRPSVMTTLSVGASSSLQQITVNGTGGRFIASDSALLIGGPGANEVVTIASMSAVTGSTAAVYLTAGLTASHNVGTTAYVSIPAQHVISLTTNNVPAGGAIQVILPAGNAAVPNLPSATGFSFNGLTSSNLSASFNPAGPTCASWTITPASGLIQCNLGVGVTGSTIITLNIGINNTSPVLVNPAKTAAAGVQDSWVVQLKTLGADYQVIDSAKAAIGTVDSVEVYATVDPFITINIAGMTNAMAVNTGNPGCTNTEVTNAGFNSTPTEVNLGVLNAARINLNSQLLTVTTNGQFGYTLTATSSGHLIDSTIGYWLADAQTTPTANDTPVPAAVTMGTSFYGIHPCGKDVPVAWATGATGGGTGAKYANPSPAYYYTLASDAFGPISNSLNDGNGITTIEYAASVSTYVPAGTYRTTMTYVATATF